ncbi:MAG: YccF domain-containing protein [Lachnospiraceae bacterium]|nr:YccF domain-containing protein [Lachnospiraceae bacterium]
MLKLIGNIIWFLFGGVIYAIAWSILGLLWCITIIGIPFGKQCFKLAELYLWPFGKNVTPKFEKHPIANLIWALFFGWEMAVANVIWGFVLCITIIGIPFGKQMFKLATLSLFPFGANVR